MATSYSLLLLFKIKFMQSWKFNSHARTFLFYAIGIGLKIPYTDVYKTLRNFNHNDQTIKLKNGKIYKIILEEI